MPDIALYYPYIHVRDDAWLKAAALCWPKLARIAPPNYPKRDTKTARALIDGLDFFVEVDPGPPARAVGQEFVRLLQSDRDRILAEYRASRWEERWVRQSGGMDGSNRGPMSVSVSAGKVRVARDPEELTIAHIHGADIDDATWRWLVDVDLATTVHGRHGHLWLRMDTRLVAVYMTMLADEVARTNGIPVVTDEVGLYGVLNGWRRDLLGTMLLADDAAEQDDDSLERADMSETYALLAIRTYLPAGLTQIPPKKVIEARKVLLPEFHAFQDHLEALHDDFAEIAQVRDSGVRDAKLRLLLERKVQVPGADLQRTLRKLGLQPAGAILSVQTPKLPGLTAAVAGGVPAMVAHGGAIAGRLVSAGLDAGQAAERERRSAHGYLLGLREELTPRGVVDRVRRTFRHIRRR